MGIARVVAVIGALSGLLSVGLSLVLPELMAWYMFEIDSGDGYYLTGLGRVIIKGMIIEREISILVLIGGIAIILGAILCIVSAIKESKKIGFFGGILMLLGPGLLIADFLMRISDLAGAIGSYVDILGKSIFWGTYDDGFFVYTWSLWVGFYIASVGGVLGLLGGIAY